MKPLEPQHLVEACDNHSIKNCYMISLKIKVSAPPSSVF